MKFYKKIALFLAVISLCGLTLSFDLSDKQVYTTLGRTEQLEGGGIALIGSASSVTFGFKGDKCDINLRAHDDNFEHHAYVVIELDGQYYSRYKVLPGGTKLSIVASGSAKTHTLSVYKATEAANGQVIFLGAVGTLMKATQKPKKKIAFIGDSITCGMGNDFDEIPCGSGEWFDQHNAYYSYAPIAARTVGADFVLSSVSGIGMYRNWNDEHKDEAIMPDVYENLYLNKDASKKYDFAFVPDVTCIALGTNDFSDGDGKKARLPFNEDTYVANYIAFINTVYKHAPKTQIVLLTSPMVNGAKAETFAKCLNRVRDEVNKQTGHKPVQVFNFTEVTPHGCGYHPSIEDDKAMAAQLAPVLKTLLK
jgi:lysophospholipase L1-like esterase